MLENGQDGAVDLGRHIQGTKHEFVELFGLASWIDSERRAPLNLIDELF